MYLSVREALIDETFVVLYLRGEASVADGALERPLFGVAAIVDLEGGMAGERLVANVARRIPSHCRH